MACRASRGYARALTAADVLATLRAHEAALRGRGVARTALFGSAARGEAGPDSDLDILVEIDPAARVDLYAYVGITHMIAGLFPGRVDEADRAMLLEPVRHAAERKALYAF